MHKLGDFGSKDAAMARGERLIDEGYVVVVSEVENQAGDEVRYIVWGTRDRTVFTGGWNR